jgi:hypothetical protein
MPTSASSYSIIWLTDKAQWRKFLTFIAASGASKTLRMAAFVLTRGATWYLEAGGSERGDEAEIEV